MTSCQNRIFERESSAIGRPPLGWEGIQKLYDKNNDSKKESLIVYLQPVDKNGDIIKAAGSVDIQLWDLNSNEDNALMGSWQVRLEELRKLWFATIVTINYRLTFDVSNMIEEYNQPLVVKMTFTDYLSGRTFTEQKVIKP